MRIALLRNIIREEMKAKLKKGMDPKMIKKQISSIEQQIEDEEVKVLRPEMGLGSLVIFPSYQWHRSAPVTKGTKESLAMWCLGPPFR